MAEQTSQCFISNLYFCKYKLFFASCLINCAKVVWCFFVFLQPNSNLTQMYHALLPHFLSADVFKFGTRCHNHFLSESLWVCGIYTYIYTYIYSNIHKSMSLKLCACVCVCFCTRACVCVCSRGWLIFLCGCVVQGTCNWISRHAFISVMEAAASWKEVGPRAANERDMVDRQTHSRGGARRRAC